MAKKNSKKKKNSQKQQPMSPERFMREKVRSLPIGKCFITPKWQETGLCQILVSRIRPHGNLAFSLFLVDTFCIGVKDAAFDVNVTPEEFSNLIENLKSVIGFEEISYNEAHNIIYGAIAFAKEGGINPDTSFTISRYILEEDTEDIPLIEYEFGRNGKHLLVIKPDTPKYFYLKKLKDALGDDFDYLIPETFDDYLFRHDDEYEEDYDDPF